MLITGGAGFIGANSAIEFQKRGWDITIVDNLSRAGTQLNLDWLKKEIPLDFHQIDIRDYNCLRSVFYQNSFDAVLHLAAQVAVTTSVVNPREDFEVNALGTFNVLECVRLYSSAAHFLYASTNKVYGELSHLKVVVKDDRYEYQNSKKGINEDMPLDFHSPYGCSKGAGDQYVIDYSRIYDLKTTSLRQSCVYGPRQFGMEDQGWVAWFMIATLLNRSITIYGDGKQIRDVLHVDDLINLYEQCLLKPEKSSGQAFNVGGGVKNTLSLLELLDFIKSSLGKESNISYSDWRPGDQKVYVSEISKVENLLNWTPKLDCAKGLPLLLNWIKKNQKIFETVWESTSLDKSKIAA